MCAAKGQLCVDGGTPNARCVDKTTSAPTTPGGECPPDDTDELLCPDGAGGFIPQTLWTCGEPIVVSPGCERPNCECPEQPPAVLTTPLVTLAEEVAGLVATVAAPIDTTAANSTTSVDAAVKAAVDAVGQASAALANAGCAPSPTSTAQGATGQCAELYAQLQAKREELTNAELKSAAAQGSGGTGKGGSGVVSAATTTGGQATTAGDSAQGGADATTRAAVVVEVSVALKELDTAKAVFEAAGCDAADATSTRTECVQLQTNIAQAQASYDRAKAAADEQGPCHAGCAAHPALQACGALLRHYSWQGALFCVFLWGESPTLNMAVAQLNKLPVSAVLLLLVVISSRPNPLPPLHRRCRRRRLER